MKQDVSKEKAKIRLSFGLGRTLSIIFLMFALIPMVLVIAIGYPNARNSLKKKTEIALKTTAILKTREINAYFEGMLADLKHQAETDSNTRLLEELANAYKTSGKPLEAFVKSYGWTAIVDEFASDIKKFRRAYNYHDIFLISKNGDILFAVAGEYDLGTNLFTGKYSSSKFAKTVKKSLESGKLVFSDYERYEPSKNRIFGFLTYPVMNRDGDIVGTMAFQFPINPINRIMQTKTGLGQTAETYLVGADLRLRSESVLNRKKNLIKEKILTDQTKLIKQQLNKNISIKEVKHAAFVYRGAHGRPVLGVHHYFKIQDVYFSVVVEIDEKEAFAETTTLRSTLVTVVSLTVLMVLIITLMLARRLIQPLLLLSSGAKRVKQGDFTQPVKINTKNEIGTLAVSFNTMMESLKNTKDENILQDWFKTGRMKLTTDTTGIFDIPEISRIIITFLARYLNADIGAIYIVKDTQRLRLTGSYAFSTRKHLSNEFDFGQGLVGQAALEKQRIILTNVPEDYITVQSGLGGTRPHCIIVEPFIHDNEVFGVIELGYIKPLSEKTLKFLDLACEQIAISVKGILAHIQVQNLLEKSQVQTEELEVQQEELRQTNETLEKQTKSLKISETELQTQQEELRQTNDALTTQSSELEEQTAKLEVQKNEIQKQNILIEQTKRTIEKKADDLEAAGRYKSEFLSNMSHELRTPLNSILLLSKHLADNRDGNLTEKQVECADTVHTSGNELLNLINDVLDLTKIEAGHMVLKPEDTLLKDITRAMERNFKPVAEEKGIEFHTVISETLPPIIRTDVQHLSQILKNLLSNAFKFTDKGSVTLEVCRPGTVKNASTTDKTIAFMVKDTGHGIPEDKQDIVFQAFKQADGSISRNYGGTGLGLSISREYANLLGGDLKLSSSEGEGSVFTLCIPEIMADKSTEPEQNEFDTNKPKPQHSQLSPGSQDEYIPDDRKTITPESRSILIIEDDPKFAKILRDVAREKGFKTLVAESGEIGLYMTGYYSPDGIILDMGLPGIDGQGVILRLKTNLLTRHIPVHVISASDQTLEPMRMGAMGYFTKPVTMENLDHAFARIERVLSKKIKDVLVVEEEKATQQLITNILRDDMLKVTIASTGQEARVLIKEKDFDCIVFDLDLPDMPGMELLIELRQKEDLHSPVIIYSAKDLSFDERAMLDNFSERIVIKGTKSREKLLDETTLFLHRVEADLPEEKRAILRIIHDREAILENKKILIVDDDMRNVFALMNILEEKGIKIIVANNGKESLAKLKENPDTDLVLMDIMMPVMDGYTAMKEIRKMATKISKTPIIALTAKAMKGDRKKCIKSGASDYLSKPVDADKLLSMLRVWLY